MTKAVTPGRLPLGNGEDQEGGIIVPGGTIEIRQSVEDLTLDFGCG